MALLVHLLRKSARERWRGLLLMACVLTVATASTSALLALAVGSPDLSGRASLAFGPNLVADPKPSALASSDEGPLDLSAAAPGTLSEASLARLGSIHHAARLAAVGPVLEGTVARPAEMQGHAMPALVPIVGLWLTDHSLEIGLPAAATEAKGVFTWWQVEGRWPGDAQGGAGALVGRRAAQALMVSVGGTLTLEAADGRTAVAFVVAGLLTTGDADEERVIIDLAAAQALLGMPGRVSRVLVAAAVVPDDDLARRDPDSMSDRDYERWYCTPYLGAVARQVAEAVAGSEVRPVLQVSRVNGEVQERLGAFSLAMVAIVGAASAAAAGAATAARQLDRSRETSLFEALGATRKFAFRLAAAENLLAAACGGAAGVSFGYVVSAAVTQRAFGVALPPSPLALGAAFLLSIGCALLGARVAFALMSRRSLSAVLGGS